MGAFKNLLMAPCEWHLVHSDRRSKMASIDRLAVEIAVQRSSDSKHQMSERFSGWPHLDLDVVA